MRVVVNSLPKSGTHLLGKVMDLFGFSEFSPGLTGALVRGVEKNYLLRWRKRRRKASENSINGLPIDLDVSTNWIRKEWLQNFINQIPDGYYITGHLPYSIELSNFLVANEFKILFISRDPRDVLVSYINFQKARKDYPFHEFFINANDQEQVQAVLNGLVRGKNVLSPFANRLNQARGWLNDEKTLALHYENLIGEAGYGNDSEQYAAVCEIVEWLEIDGTENEIRDIANCIFDPHSETFHKGTIGQWKTGIDQDSLNDLMIRCGGLIKEYGYL